tara:strand:+ start:464 stop:664 length:201 start_codon:yes stop_codon:yes gene_type:complete
MPAALQPIPEFFVKVERHGIDGRLDQRDRTTDHDAAGQQVHHTEGDGKVHAGEGDGLGHGGIPEHA